ncbi:unnamed protein product [Amoebophrya sp. A120]|nr:unnamed protein product [Amoebophrya sp. A120]|eukprot:GSA120T00011399001.1
MSAPGGGNYSSFSQSSPPNNRNRRIFSGFQIAAPPLSSPLGNNELLDSVRSPTNQLLDRIGVETMEDLERWSARADGVEGDIVEADPTTAPGSKGGFPVAGGSKNSHTSQTEVESAVPSKPTLTLTHFYSLVTPRDEYDPQDSAQREFLNHDEDGSAEVYEDAEQFFELGSNPGAGIIDPERRTGDKVKVELVVGTENKKNSTGSSGSSVDDARLVSMLNHLVDRTDSLLAKTPIGDSVRLLSVPTTQLSGSQLDLDRTRPETASTISSRSEHDVSQRPNELSYTTVMARSEEVLARNRQQQKNQREYFIPGTTMVVEDGSTAMGQELDQSATGGAFSQINSFPPNMNSQGAELSRGSPSSQSGPAGSENQMIRIMPLTSVVRRTDDDEEVIEAVSARSQASGKVFVQQLTTDSSARLTSPVLLASGNAVPDRATAGSGVALGDSPGNHLSVDDHRNSPKAPEGSPRLVGDVLRVSRQDDSDPEKSNDEESSVPVGFRGQSEVMKSILATGGPPAANGLEDARDSAGSIVAALREDRNHSTSNRTNSSKGESIFLDDVRKSPPPLLPARLDSTKSSQVEDDLVGARGQSLVTKNLLEEGPPADSFEEGAGDDNILRDSEISVFADVAVVDRGNSSSIGTMPSLRASDSIASVPELVPVRGQSAIARNLLENGPPEEDSQDNLRDSGPAFGQAAGMATSSSNVVGSQRSSGPSSSGESHVRGTSSAASEVVQEDLLERRTTVLMSAAEAVLFPDDFLEVDEEDEKSEPKAPVNRNSSRTFPARGSSSVTHASDYVTVRDSKESGRGENASVRSDSPESSLLSASFTFGAGVSLEQRLGAGSSAAKSRGGDQQGERMSGTNKASSSLESRSPSTAIIDEFLQPKLGEPQRLSSPLPQNRVVAPTGVEGGKSDVINPVFGTTGAGSDAAVPTTFKNVPPAPALVMGQNNSQTPQQRTPPPVPQLQVGALGSAGNIKLPSDKRGSQPADPQRSSLPPQALSGPPSRPAEEFRPQQQFQNQKPGAAKRPSQPGEPSRSSVPQPALRSGVVGYDPQEYLVSGAEYAQQQEQQQYGFYGNQAAAPQASSPYSSPYAAYNFEADQEDQPLLIGASRARFLRNRGQAAPGPFSAHLYDAAGNFIGDPALAVTPNTRSANTSRGANQLQNRSRRKKTFLEYFLRQVRKPEVILLAVWWVIMFSLLLVLADFWSLLVEIWKPLAFLITLPACCLVILLVVTL